MSLVEQAHDEDLSVRETVAEALVETGRYEPALVLSSCGSFMAGNAKVREFETFGFFFVALNWCSCLSRLFPF